MLRTHSTGMLQPDAVSSCRAVISNASVWDTQKLLPAGAAPGSWRKEALATPMTGSFMHLHLGKCPPCPAFCTVCQPLLQS